MDNPAFQDRSADRIRGMAARLDEVLRTEFGEARTNEAVMALAQVQLASVAAAVPAADFLGTVERLHATIDLLALAIEKVTKEKDDPGR